MKVSKYLEKMLAFYDSPSKWTQHTWYRDNKFRPVCNERSSRIVCSCISGCIALVTKSDRVNQDIREVFLLANPSMKTLIGWNDDKKRTFIEVKNTIRKTIKYAKNLEVSKKKG